MSDQPTEKPDAPAPAAEGRDAPAAEPKTEQPSNADKPSEETAAAAPATEAKGTSAAESETGKAELNGKEESKAEGTSAPSWRHLGGNAIAIARAR